MPTIDFLARRRPQPAQPIVTAPPPDASIVDRTRSEMGTRGTDAPLWSPMQQPGDDQFFSPIDWPSGPEPEPLGPTPPGPRARFRTPPPALTRRPGPPLAPTAPQVEGPLDYQSIFNQIFPGSTLTPEMLKSQEAELARYGMRVHTSASGNTAFVDVPGIGIVDVIGDVGGRNTREWQPPGSGGGGGGEPSYAPAFDDPSSRFLEQYLSRQISDLEAQRGAQTQRTAAYQQRLPEIQQSVQRLIDLMNQRATGLRGPAYTGPEQEILRTGALDPIERDRQGARQRALEQIGARGMDPTSGVALQLLNDVDAHYDRLRAGAQNQLAYRQIQEQRSREQEAQQLLGSIPQLQRGAITGEQELLEALDAAANRPRERGAQYATQLQQLPSLALRDALATMGMGTGTNDLFNQSMGLYNVQQQRQQLRNADLEAIGQLLAMLSGGGR